MHIVLASGSPRRKELLGYFPFDINVIVPEVQEQFNPDLSPTEVVVHLASLKRDEVMNRVGDLHPVIAADTIVVMHNTILGKPKDKNDARRMLSQLSGKTHEVLTGVAVAWKGKKEEIAVRTAVTFKHLSDQEIVDYTATDEPYDKAGSYALQGIGAFMVEKIQGSHSNVIGLPVAETISLFQHMGIITGLHPKTN